jgi:hypothetical protein
MTHGTQYAYRIHKCRCDECRAWKRADKKKYPSDDYKKRMALNAERYRVLKESTPCADCGQYKRASACDFDHLPGSTKRYGVSQMMGMSWATITDEIAKCELVCRNCHRERTHQRRNPRTERLRAAERLNRELKQSSPCMDCGEMYPFYVMDWDHRNPSEKTHGVARIRAVATLLAEIAKCDLVCACCHAIRTDEQRERGLFSYGASLTPLSL